MLSVPLIFGVAAAVVATAVVVCFLLVRRERGIVSSLKTHLDEARQTLALNQQTIDGLNSQLQEKDSALRTAQEKADDFHEKLLQAATSEARAKESWEGAQSHVSKLEARIRELEGLFHKNEALRIQAETENRALRDSLDSEKKLLEKAKEQLHDSFKSLAATALEGNNKQFLELARSALEKETHLARADLDKRQQSIHELVNPLTKVLDKYQEQFTEMEKERQKSYNTVESELKKVIESNVSLSKETAHLKDALKRPHVRGRWGEVQLRNCIELAGMSEYADVTFQDVTTDDDGQRLIPDMTVRMPGGRVVVVDAKTPIDAFMASLEAASDEEHNTQMARHGRHVKEHVKKLSTRAYSDGLKESADFTVMFLPNESFLYAALEVEPDLVEFALHKKVLIATPPTLIGLLKVIRFGWNEEKLAQNAMKISEAGQELHKRICDFVDAYISIGKHLEKAKSEYDIGFMRLERRVLVQARRMESLGIKGKKSLPQGLGYVSEESTSLDEIKKDTLPEQV